MFDYETDQERPPGETPASHRKKVYSLERFLSDLLWLAANTDGLTAVYLDRELDPPLREAVMLSVAYENRCRYCSFMHGEWAIEAGLDPEVERELIGLEPEQVPAEIWKASLYARRRASRDFAPIVLRERRLLAEHFTPRQQYLLEVAARTMAVANLVGNSFDALLSRMRGEPVPHSQLGDEVLFGALFALAAPFGAALLAVLTGHHPLELLTRFLQFSEVFERRVSEGRLHSIDEL